MNFQSNEKPAHISVDFSDVILYRVDVEVIDENNFIIVANLSSAEQAKIAELYFVRYVTLTEIGYEVELEPSFCINMNRPYTFRQKMLQFINSL